MEEETRENNKPTQHLQYNKVYTIALDSYPYRYLKELSAYDTEMPKMIAFKVQDTFVRCDVIITPSTLTYMLKKFEGLDTSDFFLRDRKAVQRFLLKLYDIQNRIEEDSLLK